MTKAGKYGDQHGLILRVQPSGSKQWIWRGTVNRKRCDLGLGGYPYVGLAEARAQAFEYRKAARQGNDPSALRSDAVPTFSRAAETVVLFMPLTCALALLSQEDVPESREIRSEPLMVRAADLGFR